MEKERSKWYFLNSNSDTSLYFIYIENECNIMVNGKRVHKTDPKKQHSRQRNNILHSNQQNKK